MQLSTPVLRDPILQLERPNQAKRSQRGKRDQLLAERHSTLRFSCASCWSRARPTESAPTRTSTTLLTRSLTARARAFLLTRDSLPREHRCFSMTATLECARDTGLSVERRTWQAIVWEERLRPRLLPPLRSLLHSESLELDANCVDVRRVRCRVVRLHTMETRVKSKGESRRDGEPRRAVRREQAHTGKAAARTLLYRAVNDGLSVSGGAISRTSRQLARSERAKPAHLDSTSSGRLNPSDSSGSRRSPSTPRLWASGRRDEVSQFVLLSAHGGADARICS